MFRLTNTSVELSLLMAQESQTSPKPNPVLISFDAQKGTLAQATLQSTEKRTAIPVPAMPAENRSRSSGSSGPAFLSERMVDLPSRFLSMSRDSRLSHAWNEFLLNTSRSFPIFLPFFFKGDGLVLAFSGLTRMIPVRRVQIYEHYIDM